MSSESNPYSEFIQGFELKKNDVVFISSDISNLAKNFKETGILFDVNKFIETLQDCIPNGTLIIPAYTDDLRNDDVFDYQKSKPTTGALSNRVGRRKDFVRTFDPLHSVYVWGAKNEEIQNLMDESTFGENSIFGFLARENAKFIFIDVDLQDSFTFIHYLEEKQKVKYRSYNDLDIHVKNKDIVAIKRIRFHTKKMGVSTYLYVLQAFLLTNSFMLEKKYFGTRTYLSDAEKMTNGVIKFQKSGNILYKFNVKLFMKQMVKRLIGKKYF